MARYSQASCVWFLTANCFQQLDNDSATLHFFYKPEVSYIYSVGGQFQGAVFVPMYVAIDGICVQKNQPSIIWLATIARSSPRPSMSFQLKLWRIVEMISEPTGSSVSLSDPSCDSCWL